MALFLPGPALACGGRVAASLDPLAGARAGWGHPLPEVAQRIDAVADALVPVAKRGPPSQPTNLK